MKTQDTKKKVALKIVKLKQKIAKKCAKPAKVVGVIALALLADGCMQTPSRAQTISFRECTVNVYGGKDTTQPGTLEIGTQAMSIENSGTETMTPTMDVKPDIDVSVPVNKAGAAQSVGSVLGDAVAGLIKGSSSSSSTTADAGGTDGACTDGSCTPN